MSSDIKIKIPNRPVTRMETIDCEGNKTIFHYKNNKTSSIERTVVPKKDLEKDINSITTIFLEDGTIIQSIFPEVGESIIKINREYTINANREVEISKE